MHRFTFLSFAISVVVSHSAFAAEPVRILSGGVTSQKAFNEMKEEIEKATNAKIEVGVTPTDNGMIAIIKGAADVCLPATSIEAAFASVEKKGIPKQSLDDYQWFENHRSTLRIGVHPDNPVKELSTQQISDILTGKIKTWEPLAGQKAPITFILAKNYQGTSKLINEKYLKGEKSPIQKEVLDNQGMMKAIQADPGAFGFFTAEESLPGFKPKYFKSDAHQVVNFLMKKKARPEAQRVFDYLKERAAKNKKD